MSYKRFELVDEGNRGKYSIIDLEGRSGQKEYNCRSGYDMEALVDLLNEIDCRAKCECGPEELDFS